MGDCGSRPTTSELEQHVRDYNSKNDSQFRAIPFERKIKQSIKEETTKKGLQSRLKLYQHKNQEYLALFSSTTAGLPPIPELTIEIQKGIHLHTNNICFSQGKPYVTIQLEPKGPKFETFKSDIYMPYWFKLFQLKQSFNNFTHLSVKAWHRRNVTNDLLIGSLDITISDLEDQQVKEGWFDLQNKNIDEELKPSLKLRIQLIHDEKLLLRSLSNRCQRVMEKIFLAIKRLDKSEEEKVEALKNELIDKNGSAIALA